LCCFCKNKFLQVGSYNDIVGPLFRQPYDDRTLGVVVVTTPSFFEITFKRWLVLKKRSEESLDEFASKFSSGPIESFFTEKFAHVQQVQMQFLVFEPLKINLIRDNDLLPNRRPKILMTTCGHVSGAAFLYHPPEAALASVRTSATKKSHRVGVCLHPKYGGHFAFRGALIFPEIFVAETFEEKRAPMLLDTVEKQNEAVELFNSQWQSGKYRDCGNPEEKYSPLQLKYFSTLPSDRWPLIAHWFQ
uniref:Cyanocobalamin reductase (cyanide-eliminating) n=1 Tax=Gongylonema pulchrum TaxID=637853 RepID=A0A183DWN0_9BILA